MNECQSKLVVVTGSSGFIGRYSCACLKRNGFDVLTVGRSNSDDVHCDLSLPESLSKLNSLPPYKAFIHLGAHVGWDGSSLEDMYLPNVISTALIADLVRKNNAHLIFSSAAVIAGLHCEEISASSENRSDTPYARSKELAEICIEASGVSATILRIGGVYGKNGPSHLGLNRTIQRALLGKPPQIFGTGSGKRNYIYVEDLASIIVHSVHSRTSGTHLVSGSDVLSIAEMYQSICDMFQLTSAPNNCPGDSSRSQVLFSLPDYTGKTSFSDSLRLIKLLATKLP
jgi:nucleoside-diphosphate-sugar epimerase